MRQKLLATMVAGAFASAAGIAYAGPISVASVGTYAVEAMGTTVNVRVGNVAYTLTSPFAINSTQSLKYALDSKISTCPAVTFTPNVATATIGAGVLSTDKLSCGYTVTTTTDPVPANTTVNFVDGFASSGPLATLAGKIDATISVLDNSLNIVESNTAVVAQSAHAFTASVVSSSTLTPNPERSRVDITTTPTPGTAFSGELNDITNSSLTINLGRLRITESPGVQLAANGTTDVTFANLTAQVLDSTVTGPFLIKAANGNLSSVFLATNGNCTGSIASVNPTAADGAEFTGVDILPVAADVDGNKNVYVCYTRPDPNNSAIPTGQFVADLEVAPSIGAVDLAAEEVAATNIYNLGLNGVQVDIRNYVPNAFAGWFSAYRIINTGRVATTVKGQFIGQDGAAVGTAQDITASIPAGGVTVVNSAAIEGILGAASAPGGIGPRLRLTGNTNSLRVQAFACQPSGPCFLNTDAQGADSDLSTNQRYDVGPQ